MPIQIENLKDNETIHTVRKFGNSSSDAVLDPKSQIFRDGNVDGLIGYRIDSSSAIVYGDPVCRQEDVPELIESFRSFCTDRNLNVIYIGASKKFAEWAIQSSCKILMEFGEELTIDPHNDPRAREGVNAGLVRRKVRHAIKEGLMLQEYVSRDPKKEEALEQIATAWLKNRKGFQMHISHVHLFQNRPGKRWFYAKKEDKIVGVVVLNRLENKKGWLLNRLMFMPDAPHGTPEYLVTLTLEILKNEDCRYVTFGSTPANEINEIVGLNTLFAYGTRFIYKCINKLFHLDSKKKFWSKFHPESEPSYLLFSRSVITPNQMKALHRALH